MAQFKMFFVYTELFVVTSEFLHFIVISGHIIFPFPAY